MTIISHSEYIKSPGKYIQRAKEGERVIISSKGVYVELNPLELNDKDVAEYNDAKCFLSVTAKAKKELEEGKCRTINSISELHQWFDSL